MTIKIRDNGQDREIASSGEMFTRTLSLQGQRSSTAVQRKTRYIGSHVKVSSVAGVLVRTVTAISTDGLTWKDESGEERYTKDILV